MHRKSVFGLSYPMISVAIANLAGMGEGKGWLFRLVIGVAKEEKEEVDEARVVRT